MKRILAIALTISLLFILTGCWDQHELNRMAFVQGVAVDINEKGKIILTTQFYKPASGEKGGSSASKGGSYINIQTKASSIHEAIRDIQTKLGRKAHWSHLEVILIGEPLAEKMPIENVLDYFIRNHEMRLTTKAMITKGEAKKYLNIEPLIESSISEQLRTIQINSLQSNSKKMDMNLLELAIQLKSKVDDAMVPLLYLNEVDKIDIAGVTLLKNGEIAGEISPANTQYLNMLTNDYTGGIINIPCKKSTSNKETFEVTTLSTKIRPKIIGNSVKAHVSVKLNGAISSLTCTSIITTEALGQFQKSIENVVKKQLTQTIDQLQKQKTDAIGIGNRLYAKNPNQWEKNWKMNWEEHFSKIPFTIDVKVNVSNTKMQVGKPFGK